MRRSMLVIMTIDGNMSGAMRREVMTGGESFTISNKGAREMIIETSHNSTNKNW